MKYIISESQYSRLKEQFNPEDENNILGNPSDNTLMVADFLLRQDLVDINRLLVMDDVIQIFGFKNSNLDYFKDNSIKFTVHTIKGDIHINVERDDEDFSEEGEQRDEVFRYITELAGDFPFITWYIEGNQI